MFARREKVNFFILGGVIKSITVVLCSSDNNRSDEVNVPIAFFPRMNDHAAASVTRLGDLLNFGQLFKAFGNN